MAIEFTHHGKKWRADTPEEAIALRESLEAEDAKLAYMLHGETGLSERSKWTPDRFHGLLENVGPMQKRFLAALLESDEAISAEEAQKAIGANSLASLGGIQNKIAREVRKLELEPFDLYRVQVSWADGVRARFFWLDQGFRLAAQDADWPPEGILKGVRKEKHAAPTQQKRK